MAGACPLETIRDEYLTLPLYAEAIVDLREGAPRLRSSAFGIDLDGRRLDLRYYTQPRGGYLLARLAVRVPWRNCPASIDGDDRRVGLETLNGLAETAFRRANAKGTFRDWLERVTRAPVPAGR